METKDLYIEIVLLNSTVEKLAKVMKELQETGTKMERFRNNVNDLEEREKHFRSNNITHNSDELQECIAEWKAGENRTKKDVNTLLKVLRDQAEQIKNKLENFLK